MKELKRSVKVAEGCCSVIAVSCIMQAQFDSALCMFEVLHLFRFNSFVIARNLARKGMVFKSELKARKRILKKLGYCRFLMKFYFSLLSLLLLLLLPLLFSFLTLFLFMLASSSSSLLLLPY